MVEAALRLASREGCTRRALLGGAAFVACVGAAAATPPTRVVCLEWKAAELVLSLGLTPIAIGDVQGYRDWVVAPALPATVLDIGTRFEPNLELLRELEPDLIVATRGYGSGRTLVEAIAPVIELAPYPDSGTALESSETETRQIGRALGREREAEGAIAAADAKIDAARQKIGPSISDPICIVSLFEGQLVRIYGAASLFGNVLGRLGLRNAWNGASNQWGFVSVGLERLASLDPSTRVVALDPIPVSVRALLDSSTLWANLTFVREGHMRSIPPIWPYGSLSAAERFAELLVDALKQS